MGELADRRGLARAVHADHQHDMRPCHAVRHKGVRQGLKHACDLRREHCSHRLGRNAPLVAAACDDVAYAARHGDAEIGLDQHLFQLIERLLVELALGQSAGEIVRKCRGASRQPLAKLGEPAPLLLLRRSLIGFGTLRRTRAVRRLVLGRAIARRFLPHGLFGRRLLLGRARLWRGWGAAPKQPLHEGRLLSFAHGATTARSDAPSSPLTTASTRAPAARPASSLTGVKSAERPCASFSMSTLICRPRALSRCALSAATPFSRSAAARLAMTGPLTCGISAAGVPLRAEKGNTW